MAEKTVELIPLHTIVRKASKDAKEERYAPGTPDKPAKTFKVPESEAERLIRKGAARLAAEVEDEEAPAPKKLTRKDLHARAAELGISVSELQGTGPKGAATDDEVAAAIAAKESGTGTGGPVAGNPSVVE